MKAVCFVALFSGILILSSCTQSKKERRTGVTTLSFDSITGIRFTEVRREFDNGTVFNEQGFEQVPEWILYFLPGDSVKIYSPYEKRFVHFPIYFDHELVFNMAREWFRLKKVNRDSMVLQLLQVEAKRRINKEKSNVYMRFYSDRYINQVLHSNAEELRHPTRRDSAYIKTLSAKANRNPGKIDSAFGATTPVLFKSANPNVTVARVQPEKDPLADVMPSDVYLHPEYDIVINGAYKNFVYNFSVLVDHTGILHFGELLTVVEDPKNRRMVLDGIIKVYLQKLLKITPGTTLGYPHTSVVILKVTGNKTAINSAN